MTSESERLPAPSGPWVQMALFCEKVIEDKEGVLTIVRIVDRVIVAAAGPNLPRQMQPFDYALHLVVTLKAGEAIGRGTVSIESQGPDGLVRPGPALSVLFESPDRGHNVILEMRFRFDREGPYWFNVRYDGRLLTRIPLRVVYQPTMTATTQAP